MIESVDNMNPKSILEISSVLLSQVKHFAVDTVGSVRCRSPDGIRLRGQHGYIASIVTRDSNAGSADCPWVIEVDLNDFYTFSASFR